MEGKWPHTYTSLLFWFLTALSWQPCQIFDETRWGTRAILCWSCLLGKRCCCLLSWYPTVLFYSPCTFSWKETSWITTRFSALCPMWWCSAIGNIHLCCATCIVMNLMYAICIQNLISFFPFNKSLTSERINIQHMLLESVHITTFCSVLCLCLLWIASRVIQLRHNT